MTMSIKNLFDKEIERTGALIGEQHRLNPRGIKMFGELPPDPLEALSIFRLYPRRHRKKHSKRITLKSWICRNIGERTDKFLSLFFEKVSTG